MPPSEEHEDNTAPRRRTTPSRWFMAVVIAVPLILAAVVGYAVRQAGHATTHLEAETGLYLVVYPPAKQKVPSGATLQRLGGGAPILLGGSTGRGQPHVVNFFASWCPVCRQELTAIASVARTSRIPFIGVDTDDTATATALQLLRQARATYPVGIGQAPLAESYGASALPTTAFVNAKGRVVAIYLGRLHRSQLARYVADLEAGKPL